MGHNLRHGSASSQSPSRLLRAGILLSLVSLAAGTGPVRPAGNASAAPASRPSEVRLAVETDPGEVSLREGKPAGVPAGRFRVVLAGGVPVRTEGGYELPAKLVRVEIPDGFRAAGVMVKEIEEMELASSLPLAAREPSSAARETGIRVEVTDGSEVAVLLGDGAVGGHRIATVLVNPFAYDALRGNLTLRRRVDLAVRLRPEETGEAPRARLRAGPRGVAAQERLAEAALGSSRAASPAPAGVDQSWQPRALGAFLPEAARRGGFPAGDFQILTHTTYPSLEGSLVEYLIITDDDLVGEFQRLADWYIEQGLPAAVRTISQIETAYPHGVDLPERIRLFIQDAYAYWGTVYVLLGGDVGIVPVRLVFNSYTHQESQGNFIASDLYYGALDGTWDADGDGIFGERWDPSVPAWGDSADLFPEVHVGRASVETLDEAALFVTKTLTYARDPDVGYQERALFVSQVVFCDDPCVLPDSIILNGAWIADSAAAYVPADWDTLKIYEWPHQNLGYDAVIDALNDGYNLLTVVNHGDQFKMSTGDGSYLTIPDAMGLTNSRRFFNMYYLNCNTSEVEAECINEYLMLNPDGGAVTVVAPTRYDWPHVGKFFLKEYYRLLFEVGVTEAGALQDLQKVPFEGWARGDPAILWNYMAYILLGDPALPIWRVAPDTLALSHAGSLAVGDTAYAVTVSAGGLPVNEALVTVWKKTTGEYGRASTGPDGAALVPFAPLSEGALTVTASHPEHLAARDSAAVVTGSTFLYVESTNVDDDEVGLSSGNGDGQADAGERIELGVTLKNGTANWATAVAGTLSLEPGSWLSADLSVDDVRAPGFLFVGEEGAHAVSLPCTFDLGAVGGEANAPDPWGRTHYVITEEADTSGSGWDLVTGRAYLWEDPEGWHLRAVGAFANHTIAGTLGTDGRARALAGWEVEAADTVLELAGNRVAFEFQLGAADAVDGFDLLLDDSTGVAVLSDLGSFGDVAPGGTAGATFLVDVGSARDGERKRFDLRLGGGGAPWQDELQLELHGPYLILYHQGLDDSTQGGNGDGIPQVGETLRLWPRARNEGGGNAEGVQGILRVVEGATVIDSVDVFGQVGAGSLVTGAGGFSLTVDDTPPVLAVELRDTYGTSWMDTFDLSPPAAPAGLVDDASPTFSERTVDLYWEISEEEDLWGYLVYRSPGPAGPFSLLSGRVLPRISYYQDEQVANDSAYYYRLTAVDSAGSESPPSTAIAAVARPPLQEGWPQTIYNAAWAAPVLADLEGDGGLDVVLGALDGRIYVWDAGGNIKSGWPRGTGGEIWASPAVGNLDGDSELEIVVGSNDYSVYVWNHDGTGFIDTSGVFATTTSQVRAGPTLIDLDSDGELEILVGNSAGRIYAWNADGSGCLSPDGIFAAPTVYPVIGSPAAAEVDGDGYYEIFAADIWGRVFAYNHDGTGLVDTSGIFFSEAGGDSSGFWGALAVGDVENDGEPELVGSSWNGNLYLWEMDGSLLPNWPVYVAGEEHIPSGGQSQVYRVWSSPALGDLDGDDDLEILVGSRDRRVYALHHDGSYVSGWPDTTGHEVYGGPVLADVDDDGLPEVLVASLDNALHVIQGDGSRVPGWPIRTSEDVYSSPAVDDLDEDGDLEVVLGSYDGYVYVWDVSAPWRPEASPWAHLSHDTHRSGWYDWQYPFQLVEVNDEEALGERTAAPARLVLAQNVPNPMNPVTTVRFGLPRRADLRLALFDVTGRRVCELARGAHEAGWHEVAWDGRDRFGEAVAAGVYFYRLEAEGEVLTKKMALVR